MQKDLRVNPDELRAAATRWQMIGTDLDEGVAPKVNLAQTWPSAAATDGIHAQAAAATEAFQARIGDTAAASHGAANTYQNHEATVGLGEFKDLIGAITSPISNLAGMVSGSIGSLNAVTGMLGSVSSAAVSSSSSLVNNLTGVLSHAGSPPHTPPVPVSIDTPAMQAPTDTPPAPGPTATAPVPVPIDPPPKQVGTGVVE
jgi:hypothetical protein